MISDHPHISSSAAEPNRGERGAALVIAIIVMALIAGIALATLAVVSNEAKIAGSDLKRTQAFYAAATGMEKMTSDFSALFSRTSNPTQAQLNTIAANFPVELRNEGYSPSQTLEMDLVALFRMRQSQGIINNAFPTVTLPHGPFAGLSASVAPYRLTSTVTHTNTGTQVALEREVNNYLIPLFQFGMFSDKDIELHPGPAFVFNGRIHTNGNLYLNGNVTLRDKVTVANELVYDVLRNNSARTDANVSMVVNSINVRLKMGSVMGGPDLLGSILGGRGFFPGSPGGTDNTDWKTTSVAAPQAGTDNQFGGQLLTRQTGAEPLRLPLQLGGSSPRELIKRGIAGEAVANPVLYESRYHTKAQIRILIDDEGNPADAAGIPAGQGVNLSEFDPIALDGGNALRIVNDDGSYAANLDWVQGDPAYGLPASIVRGVRNDYSIWTEDPARLNATDTDAHNSNNNLVPRGPGGAFIPPGAGIRGRILIQIVAPDGVTTRDVTREVLSMGMTEGEPNGIVYLQRPLWASFMQGSRDRRGGSNDLVSLTHGTLSRCAADGEINSANFSLDATAGFYDTAADNVDDDPHTAAAPYWPTQPSRNDRVAAGSINRIVPINVYNPREGWTNSALDPSIIYERGLTSVIEINGRNLARWLDGVYDNNLLRGTGAVSANIGDSNGYILYVSDRRGDRVRVELTEAGFPIQMSNGFVDNEDIYGPNGVLDPGEDVIDGFGSKDTLQKDNAELPDPMGGNTWSLAVGRRARAELVQGWPTNFFRRAVRIFNAENLQISGADGKLSETKGLTISTENMVYIWGSYNTTGIAAAPIGDEATLNDGGYLGPQVPSSIVADAIFPLSKTWSDSMSAYNPEGGGGATARMADVNVPGPGAETSVRAAIIAGNNLSALAGNPDAGNAEESRLNGGLHNFPRFLENWSSPLRRWNYVGSICPLYYSTQALGQYSTVGATIYSPPQRNWAFDTSFRDPTRLPPGTPLFQYIEATGFRQVF